MRNDAAISALRIVRQRAQVRNSPSSLPAGRQAAFSRREKENFYLLVISASSGICFWIGRIQTISLSRLRERVG